MDGKSSYWQTRATRRNLLRAGAITSAGLTVVGLIGCSSGGDKVIQQNRGFYEPKDTSSSARRGGIYQSFAPRDVTDFNPATTVQGAGLGGPERAAYSTLIREKEAPGGTKIGVVEGDLAESYELSDGGLRLTMKLRPNAKWDPRTPTSGRAVIADDVVYSWEKYAKVSPYAEVLANATSPTSAGIISAQKVDERTVVFKMAFPWAPLLPGLAKGPYVIVPVESEDKFDPRRDIRGSAEWMLADYQPSSNLKWRRNPNYYNQELPYLDGYDQPILTEYAAQLSQFTAKNIWDFQPSSEDVLVTARNNSALLMYEGDPDISPQEIFFNNQPGSRFLDIRVRRAVSMAIDRDLYAETIKNLSKFAAAGFPRTVFLDNYLFGGMPELWIDPRGKEMGDGAQYFQYNPTEAKKLLNAAGYSEGFDMRIRWDGQVHVLEKEASIVAEMLSAVGMRGKLEQANYASAYLPKIIPSHGNFDGDIAFRSATVGFEASSGLQRALHSKGSTTGSSFDDDGQRKIDGLIEGALKELDHQKYVQRIHELQKELGLYQGAVVFTSQCPSISLAWPWVMNLQVFKGSLTGTGLRHVWIDESRRS